MNKSSQISPNPSESSNAKAAVDAGQRASHSLVRFVAAVAIGGTLGVSTAFTALAFGLHRNLPVAWLYLCGPTVWIIELYSTSDAVYFSLLFGGSILLWTCYAVIIACSGRWALVGRIAGLLLFHLSCAALYHAVVGL
jgi:hypothetical protein